MMRVKLLTILAGPTMSARSGDILELDTVTALALIDGGYAVAVEEAVAPAVVEAAVAPRQRRPRRPNN